MTAEIISIGDELLLGDTVNSHAAWLGGRLSARGVTVSRVHTVGDNRKVILETLKGAMGRAGLVITTGGLGPTPDDRTKEAVVELFETGTHTHQPTLDFIRETLKKRNIPFSESNYRQAEVPDNAEVLFNRQGTAPGLWFEEGDTLLAVLPGVPHEMKYLMENEVLVRLEHREGIRVEPFRYYLNTAGIGESTLSDLLLEDLEPLLGGSLSLAFLPGTEGVRLRIRGEGRSCPDPERVEALKNYIRERAGIHIYGEGDKFTLAEALGSLLRERGKTVAVAESCTGGLICDRLTDVPGSSDYLPGGVVAYANRIKTDLLGVSGRTLAEHGAVSRETALEMARGVAERLRSDVGISATGIAGPGGGTREKPVGTVWIGFWNPSSHFALRARFTNDRRVNKERTAAVALDTVRRTLEGIETMPYGLQPESL